MQRIVSPKSMNTENQERIFGQIKQMSKGTTNHSPSHILTNAIQRLHFEESSRDDYVAKQDSEVEKLSAAIPAIPNTKFSAKLVAESSTAYQRHLERISDYLSKGPDVWWKPTQDGGFEILDGEQEEESKLTGPPLLHFRSSSFNGLETMLHQQWEYCIMYNIILPAKRISKYRQYPLVPNIEDVRLHYVTKYVVWDAYKDIQESVQFKRNSSTCILIYDYQKQ